MRFATCRAVSSLEHGPVGMPRCPAICAWRTTQRMDRTLAEFTYCLTLMASSNRLSHAMPLPPRTPLPNSTLPSHSVGDR